MTVERKPKGPHCQDCICWVKLSDADGGIGICDNVVSDHNQHLVGYRHPACSVAVTDEDIEDAMLESEG